MKLLVSFIATFFIGPLLFWGLARRTPTSGYFKTLLITLAALVTLAFAISNWLVPALAPSSYPGLAAILVLWLSWITVLVLCVQVALTRIPTTKGRKTAFAIGAMAATLPWFGLYAALTVGQ